MTFQEMLDFLTGRKRAYQQIPDGVMHDLAKFCRATQTCGVLGDHDATMVLIGRHEVWLRIAQHRGLTPEQLFDLYGGVGMKEQNK